MTVADVIDDAALDPGGAEPETPRRPLAPFVVLGVTLLIGFLFVVLAGSDTALNEDTAETPLLGKAAPAIVGPTLDGGTFDLSRQRGDWVVLNFFQSTCVPCVNEHPELVAFADQQATLDDGAELVTVVFADNEERVREFFTANGGDWPVVLDERGQIPFEYGVAKVPETWIIDPTGRVQVHIISEVTAAGLSAKVQELRALTGGAGG